ncbi:MAG: hypothetical protein M3486_05650 [Actinomycetota bacterium]|nr:hypothetical protein [Actinomycetota bacterium]
MTGRPTAPPPDGGQQRRTLGLEHWAVVASAADLAHKATALADRYDALPDSGNARAPGRRESVARLRAAAASAQLLITSLLGFSPCASLPRAPAPSSVALGHEPTDIRAAVAARRDRAAEARVLAFEDRLATRDDRGQAGGRVPSPPAEVRAVPHSLSERLDAGRAFHQAQGMLMARSDMSAAAAFEALLLASVQQDVSLFETVGRVVQEGSWPDPRPDPPARGTSGGSAPRHDSPR